MSKTKKEISLEYTITNGVLCFADPAEGIEKNEVYIVPENSFIDNKEIKKIIFSDLITAIKDNAFKDCTNLEEIVFPKNLKIIGASAFENCTKLKDVTLGAKTKIVKENAFKNCKKLKSFTAKTNRNSAIFLEHNALKGTNLEILSLRKMDYYYDSFDKNLKYTLKHFESDFFDFIDYDLFFGKSIKEALKSPLETIKIYDVENKTTYTDFIFDLEDDDTFLTAYPHNKAENFVSVPEGTTEIDGDTFFGNPFIETLILPDTLKKIQRPIANSCNNLKTIVIKGNDIDISTHYIATNCENLEHIYMSKTCADKNDIKFNDLYKELNLDAVIESAKSIKEANKLYKELLLDI